MKGGGKRARILNPPPKARLAFTNTWGNTSRSDNYSTVLALLFRPPATSTRSVYRLSARVRVWPRGRVVGKREIRSVGREMQPTGDRCSFGVKIGVRHRNYTCGIHNKFAVVVLNKCFLQGFMFFFKHCLKGWGGKGSEIHDYKRRKAFLINGVII